MFLSFLVVLCRKSMLPLYVMFIIWYRFGIFLVSDTFLYVLFICNFFIEYGVKNVDSVYVTTHSTGHGG